MEIYKVEKSVKEVVCDGRQGALGHPKVYYNLDGIDEVTCSYCSAIFTKKNRKGAKNYKEVA